MAGKLTSRKQEEVLKSFHRVLKRQGVTGSVNVRFGTPGLETTAATSHTRCVRWVCRTQGTRTVCGWEPC
jgi:hypothetical protein